MKHIAAGQGTGLTPGDFGRPLPASTLLGDTYVVVSIVYKHAGGFLTPTQSNAVSVGARALSFLRGRSHTNGTQYVRSELWGAWLVADLATTAVTITRSGAVSDPLVTWLAIAGLDDGLASPVVYDTDYAATIVSPPVVPKVSIPMSGPIQHGDLLVGTLANSVATPDRTGLFQFIAQNQLAVVTALGRADGSLPVAQSIPFSRESGFSGATAGVAVALRPKAKYSATGRPRSAWSGYFPAASPGSPSLQAPADAQDGDVLVALFNASGSASPSVGMTPIPSGWSSLFGSSYGFGGYQVLVKAHDPAGDPGPWPVSWLPGDAKDISLMVTAVAGVDFDQIVPALASVAVNNIAGSILAEPAREPGLLKVILTGSTSAPLGAAPTPDSKEDHGIFTATDLTGRARTTIAGQVFAAFTNPYDFIGAGNVWAAQLFLPMRISQGPILYYGSSAGGGALGLDGVSLKEAPTWRNEVTANAGSRYLDISPAKRDAVFTSGGTSLRWHKVLEGWARLKGVTNLGTPSTAKTAVRFHPSGDWVAVAVGTTINIVGFNPVSGFGAIINGPDTYHHTVTALDWHPSGAYLAVAGMKNTLPSGSGQATVYPFNPITGALGAGAQAIPISGQSTNSSVKSLKYSPDGNWLFLTRGGPFTPPLAIQNVAGGTVYTPTGVSAAYTGDWSPEGDYVFAVTGSSTSILIPWAGSFGTVINAGLDAVTTAAAFEWTPSPFGSIYLSGPGDEPSVKVYPYAAGAFSPALTPPIVHPAITSRSSLAFAWGAAALDFAPIITSSAQQTLESLRKSAVTATLQIETEPESTSVSQAAESSLESKRKLVAPAGMAVEWMLELHLAEAYSGRERDLAFNSVLRRTP